MYNFPSFFSTFSAGRVECSFGKFADFSLQISDCLRSKSESDETLENFQKVVFPQNVLSWTGSMQKWQPFKKMSETNFVQKSQKFFSNCECNKTIESFQTKCFSSIFTFGHKQCDFDITAETFIAEKPWFSLNVRKCWRKVTFYKTISPEKFFWTAKNHLWPLCWNVVDKRTKNLRSNVPKTFR